MSRAKQFRTVSVRWTFFGHCQNIFRAKMAQPPRRKNWPVRLCTWSTS